jgi:type IV pilus biogenesis/stability protein PilW
MLKPGTRLGRYEILQRLGAGGMGEVFRARDSQLGRDVAIKVLPEHFAADASRLARFSREARAASALNHPNIITIHEIGETGTQPYIVMEYVDGSTLREIISAGRLSPKRVLELGAQLADGLAKAHDAGIVHRDLKPENVMVTRDGVVKIVDFGLAKPSVGLPDVASATTTRGEASPAEPKTGSGAILGTVGYMAPEQARGARVDQQADQFALGAILYELATGRRAFDRESTLQTLNDIIEHEPIPIEALNPSFPAPARWLIQRCLAKEPAERYASTHDLAGELRTIRDHLRETTGSETSSQHLPLPRPRRTRFSSASRLAALAVATVLIVAGVLAGPRAFQAARSWIAGPPLPDALHVAVLPVGGSPDALDSWAGLFEYVISRLAELREQDGRLSVVSASEILEADCRTARAASKSVNANVAVEIRVTRVPLGYQVTVGVADPDGQLLGSDEMQTYARPSLEQVVERVVRLLEVQLDATQRTRWTRARPGAPGVDAFYAQALRETPYQQARTAAERHDQEQSLRTAISLYNKAIDADPNYAAARAGLGEAYLRLHHITKQPELLDLAERSLEQARQIDDTRPAVWISLGTLYTIRGQATLAQEALKNAIQRDPSGGDAYRQLGLAYERAGLSTQAGEAFREAVRLQPDSWASRNQLGRFLAVERSYEEAEPQLLAALKQVPDNARVLANLGAVYIGLGRWDEAASSLNRAIEVNPRSGPALSNLGTLQYSHNRNYTLAADLYARAAEASPRDYRIWYNLGLAREAVPALQAQAQPAYERAASLLGEELAVDPTNPQLLVRLADCQASLGEAAKTRAAIAEASKYKPSGDDLRIAAKAEEQLGDRVAALKLLRRAFEAGLALSVVEESSPTLGDLRRDPRYAAMVESVRSGAGNSRGK